MWFQKSSRHTLHVSAITLLNVAAHGVFRGCFLSVCFCRVSLLLGVVQAAELTKKHRKKDTRSGAVNGVFPSSEQSEELVRASSCLQSCFFVYGRTMNAT